MLCISRLAAAGCQRAQRASQWLPIMKISTSNSELGETDIIQQLIYTTAYLKSGSISLPLDPPRAFLVISLHDPGRLL